MSLIDKTIKRIHEKGGSCFYVGGYVRDKILDIPNKDIDIEVYNLTLEELKSVLGEFGEVDEIGKQFAILKIHNLDVDFSLPRMEKKTGNKHTDFEIEINPYANHKDACRRRDLTCNAIMQNAITGQYVDPFNGIDDLNAGIIKYVDAISFVEDPLRVLRIAQFVARLEFKVDDATKKLCSQMVQEGLLKYLPNSRIEEEFNKLLLKGKKPSLGFEFLREIGFLYPQLKSLIGCNQNPLHHPEGDVWTHTMLVCDEAAKLRDKADNPQHLMYGALCHDFGKPSVTTPDFKAYGHDKAGIQPTLDFLTNFTENTRLISGVIKLVEFHMKVFQLSFSTKKSIRKLLVKLDDVITINDLLLLSEADHNGRKGDFSFHKEKEWYKTILDEIGTKPPEKLVTGKDLIKLGFKPGVIFSEILDFAYGLQLDKELSKEEIIKQILKIY